MHLGVVGTLKQVGVALAGASVVVCVAALISMIDDPVDKNRSRTESGALRPKLSRRTYVLIWVSSALGLLALGFFVVGGIMFGFRR